MRRLQAILLFGLFVGCAPYGLHRPARVLGAAETQLGVSLDLAAFFARVTDEQRRPERLDEALLLPALQLRQGLGARTEIDLTLYPVGLRVGGRVGLVENERAAMVAEAGISFAAGLAKSTANANWTLVLLPDAALSAGWGRQDEWQLYGALRYLWLREQIGGSGFGHTPGVTLGYAFTPGSLALDVEASAFVSPETRDWILVPGLGAAVVPE